MSPIRTAPSTQHDNDVNEQKTLSCDEEQKQGTYEKIATELWDITKPALAALALFQISKLR